MTRDQVLSLGAFALLLVLCLWTSREITDAPVRSDANVNLRMGINLAHHGTVSHSRAEPYQPSMYREPLPTIVTAGVVKVVDAILGPTADGK